MKYVCRVLCMFVSLLMLCSCGGEKSKPTPPIPSLNFSSDVQVQYQSYSVSCTIENYLNGACTVTVNSPAELKGLKLICQDSKVKMKFGTVEYEKDFADFPQSAFGTILAGVLKQLVTPENLSYKKEDSGNWRLEGDIQAGHFVIEQDGKTGYPISIVMEKTGFRADFSNTKAIKE